MNSTMYVVTVLRGTFIEMQTAHKYYGDAMRCVVDYARVYLLDQLVVCSREDDRQKTAEQLRKLISSLNTEELHGLALDVISESGKEAVIKSITIQG